MPFTSPILLFAPMFEGDEWETFEPLRFWSEKYQKGYIVPKGFKTDLASHWTVRGTINAPSVLHDWLTRQGFKFKMIETEQEAHEVFYEAMLDTGVSPRSAYLRYWAVKLWGGPHFKREQMKICESKLFAVILLSLALAGCAATSSPSLMDQLQTQAQLRDRAVATHLTDLGILKFGEAVLSAWGLRSGQADHLNNATHLALGALSTAALATSGTASADVTRGLVGGGNFILHALGIYKPTERNEARNEGASRIIEARGLFLRELAERGICHVSNTQFTSAGARYFDAIGAAQRVVDKLLVGLAPRVEDLEATEPDQSARRGVVSPNDCGAEPEIFDRPPRPLVPRLSVMPGVIRSPSATTIKYDAPAYKHQPEGEKSGNVAPEPFQILDCGLFLKDCPKYIPEGRQYKCDGERCVPVRSE